MRILFRIRLSAINKQGKACIYCRIKLNGQSATDFSTFIQTTPDGWDSAKQQIKGNSRRVHDDNERLKIIHSDITKLFLHFEVNSEPISAQHLADLYTGKQQLSYTFTQLVDLFEQHIKATYSSPGTRRNYNTRIENIRLFLIEQNGKGWQQIALL